MAVAGFKGHRISASSRRTGSGFQLVLLSLAGVAISPIAMYYVSRPETLYVIGGPVKVTQVDVFFCPFTNGYGKYCMHSTNEMGAL